MVWSVQPEAVLASAAAESAISAETEATASAAAPALLGTTPMGDDPDSAMFSAALNACGASYLGVVAEHAAQRGLFAGAQGLAAGCRTPPRCYAQRHRRWVKSACPIQDGLRVHLRPTTCCSRQEPESPRMWPTKRLGPL
ncbi:PE family protein [Mycobacterium kansasii]|uniref:PE family protein n=1 Tax=Mycobacterium kansasii TaxID=1768 RepID=A0A1V3WXM1_MYCKA|nr:PE family protein [Mycobacterium kansasii]